MSEKKKWIEPHLTVLVRNVLPENILFGCKGDPRSAMISPGNTHTSCTHGRWEGDFICRIECSSNIDS